MAFFGIAHKKRLLTGACLLLLLAVCLAAGGLPLRILAALASVAALWEFYRLCWPGSGHLPRKLFGCIAGAVLVLGLGSCFGPWGAVGLIGLSALVAALGFLCAYGREDGEASSLQEYLPLPFSLLYIPLSLQCAVDLPLSAQILALLGAVASDTGGYYAGSSLGRHKIQPRISPNKSWEGAGGGMAAAAVAVAVFASFAPPPGLEDLPFWRWALAGALLSVMAQAGDFFESALKRSAGVKDSGALLPGHGGVLDRLDSIIFVLPAYTLLSRLLSF
jgi:phosphatidate cytidylyltransferase